MSAPFERPAVNPAAVWERMAPAVRLQLGQLMVENLLLYRAERIWRFAEDEARPYDAARDLVDQALNAHADVLFTGEADSMPLPAITGPVCRQCGCTQEDACDEGCAWAEPTLCTACVPIKADEAVF